MTLRFQLNSEEIKKWPEEDYEAFEMAVDGQVKLYRLRPIISRYMIDEEGKPISQTVALKTLGKIPLDEWTDVIQKFFEGVQSIVLPKVNGTSLSLPSDQAPSSESQTGSQP